MRMFTPDQMQQNARKYLMGNQMFENYCHEAQARLQHDQHVADIPLDHVYRFRIHERGMPETVYAVMLNEALDKFVFYQYRLDLDTMRYLYMLPIRDVLPQNYLLQLGLIKQTKTPAGGYHQQQKLDRIKHYANKPSKNKATTNQKKRKRK